MEREGFLSIVFTHPEIKEGEEYFITRLLESGAADYIHIRKPGKDIYTIRSLIRKIDNRFHSRLKIHDHFSLVDEFALGGIHLNSRNPVAHPNAKEISCSFHTLKELEKASEFSYCTLSPVFDSISKKGYLSNFNPSEISIELTSKNVIALGGVTPECFPLLRDTGFAGGAMLGYVWTAEPEKIIQSILKYRKLAESL